MKEFTTEDTEDTEDTEKTRWMTQRVPPAYAGMTKEIKKGRS